MAFGTQDHRGKITAKATKAAKTDFFKLLFAAFAAFVVNYSVSVTLL
jgi:hypothetical protein